MTYTEEQLKKIAEWLGDGLPLVGSYIGGQYREFDLHEALASERKVYHLPIAEWLHSPDGQSAVMDRMLDEGVGRDISIAELNHKYCVCLEGNVLGTLPEPTIIKSVKSDWYDTRAEALIAAVLEMLEAE